MSRRRPTIPYSAAELAFIESHKVLSRAELRDRFAAKFGRDDVETDDIKSLCTRKGWATGRTGRFVAGHVPANKGMTGQCAPGSEKGWFKKGHMPHNGGTPLGHERIDKKDGYVWIKIDEPNPHTGYKHRYVQKHVLRWTKRHGDIPEGYVLKSIDDNPQNTDPDNWMCIPRAVLVSLNRWSRFDDVPDDLRKTIIAQAWLLNATNTAARTAATPPTLTGNGPSACVLTDGGAVQEASFRAAEPGTQK